MNNLLTSKFKVNIKSLAAEAKFIRKEESKFEGTSYERLCLRLHRIEDLRLESRITQLAYGFSRGKAYRTIEATTKVPLNSYHFKKIVEKLKRKGVGTTIEEVTEWAT